MAAANVKRVVEIRSEVTGGVCPHCGRVYTEDQPGLGSELEKRINHLLGHGFKILHVGQETGTDYKGDPYQATVAILGL